MSIYIYIYLYIIILSTHMVKFSGIYSRCSEMRIASLQLKGTCSLRTASLQRTYSLQTASPQ